MADKVDGDRGVPETKVEDVAVVKDEFADAFDVADKAGEKADLSAADDPAKMKEEDPVVEVPPVVTPPVVETPPVTPPISEQQPGETDEKYEQRYKTLQGIHRHDKETWEAEKVTLLSQLEEAKKPKTPEKTETTEEKKVAAEAFVDSLTPEQQEQLKEYEQDFDVVSKMEGIKRGVELAKLRKEIADWKTEITGQLAETRTQIDTRIAPVEKMAEENELETHFNTIRNGYVREDGTEVPGHDDFEKFRDDGSLQAWIESKPKYLQPSLKETYSKGAAPDVIDLITDFKRESNISLTTQPSDNVIPIDSKKATRKQALTTVTTRRGAVNTGTAIKDDYEGAFDEALNK